MAMWSMWIFGAGAVITGGFFMGEKQKRNNEKFRGNFPDG